MKTIKFTRLELENFKSLRKMSIVFSQHTRISGENHVGKTTIADAIFWVLFDKDSLGRGNNLGIATIGEDGEVIHRLHHKATLTIEVDGKTITLSKDFYEKWTKRKGSAEEVFDGNTVDYSVDLIPCTKTEYAAKIREIVSEDTFRMLTDVLHFSKQHWAEQKKTLRELAGEVKLPNEEISKPQFANLIKFLGEGHTADEYAKYISSQKRPIKERVDKIPSEIEGISQTIQEPADTAEIDKEIDTLEKEREELRSRYNSLTREIEDIGARIKAIDVDKDNKRIEIEDINKKMSDLAQAASYDENQRYENEAKAYRQYLNDLGDYNVKVANYENSIKSCEADIKERKDKLQKLSDEWREVNARQFTEDVCPTCGQQLPQEMLDEARTKFAENKKAELDAINKKGTDINAEISYLENEIAKIKELMSALSAPAEVANPKPAQTPDLSTNVVYIKLMQQKALLNEQLNKSVNVNSTIEQRRERDEVTNKINEIDSQIKAKNKEKEHSETIKQLNKNASDLIEDRKKELRECQCKLTKLEGEEQAVIDYKRIEVNTIEDAVNSKFSEVRFRFYKPLVNGGFEETCECTMHGTPYASLSASEKVNAGIDIINALQAHYGISAPIIFDNAEGVNDFLMTSAQTIKLYVSNDKEIKITDELF